jgi:hypothetical protein
MKNKSTLAFYTLLFSFCITLFSFSRVIAQENGIYEISGSDTQKDKNKSNYDRTEFYELTQKLHSTFYIGENKLKNTYGNGQPIRITLDDANSFNFLTKDSSKFSEVEIITMTLNNQGDLNNKLNLSSLNNLKKLKYIYLKCDFKCTDKQIKEFIKYDSNVRVFYKIENPS